MTAPIIQPSFAAGELSPSLYGRVDLAKFHVGAALMRNFFADYRGGASNRPGTSYVGPCFDGVNRLIPFQFSTQQAYSLVFSDRKMRVVMEGGMVLEEAHVIIAVGRVNPCYVSIGGGPPASWVADDWIFVSGAFSADVTVPYPLNGRFFRIVPDPLGVFLYDLDGNPVDASAWPSWLVGGLVSKVFTLTTPYSQFDLALLKFTQSADTMTLCHPSYPPQQLTRTGHAAWTMTPASFVPNAAAPILVSATPSSFGDGTQYTYLITAVAANGVTESLPSNAVSAVNSKTMSTASGAHITVQWNAVNSAQYYNVYRQAEVAGGAPSGQQLYGFVGTTTGISFVDANITPDFTRTPPQSSIPFAGGNNPGCVSYYQSREVFAGSAAAPQTFWMSKTSDFLNMGYSSPARADDSIVGTIAAQQVNAIKHLVPMDSLIMLTNSGAWRVDAGANGGAVTPSAIEAVPQAYNGCSDVPPITINQDILYVQAKGSIVRDLSYNFYARVYTGSDLTVLSNHLFFGHKILEWAWAEEPFKIIWAVREDGVALMFTFLKEQDVYAWSHADTDGQFKSVCSISEGDANAVYFVVSRLVRGKYRQFVERLESRSIGAVPELGVPADFSKFWFVDCGLRSPLTTYGGTTLTPSATTALPSVVGATVVIAGTGYTAPTLEVIDATGTGARLTPTVVGGVIVAVAVTAAGTNYSNPTVKITDATGAGAVIALSLSRDVEVTANLAAFGSVVVGSLVLMNSGYGYVRTVNSARSITVNVYQPFGSIYPAAPGTWSITAPVSKVYGLDHLEGREVSILADGNVHTSQIVVNGSVTLDRPASAIVVGLKYTAQLQSLYCDLPAEPTVQGRRKSIPAATVRMQDTRGLKVGRAFDSEMREFKERRHEIMGAPITPITGDMRVVINGSFDVPGQVCIEQDYPLPATVLALIPEITVGDTPG